MKTKRNKIEKKMTRNLRGRKTETRTERRQCKWRKKPKKFRFLKN